MGTSEHTSHDVVGIGFGPSNLSLSIALAEHAVNASQQPLNAMFFERQPAFGWHRDMLLPESKMQISFLKDLVTFRNPASRFSFVAYLHESGRLAQFTNNADFYPTRHEFHQYLQWAQARQPYPVCYGAEVTAIRLPPEPGPVDHLDIEVRVRGGGVRRVSSRNVVVSTGLVPRVPDGVALDDRVWHSEHFLSNFHRMDPAGLTAVAVVGAGQSAAEITRFLHGTLPHARVYAVVPSYGYTVADATPFANQVFDPRAVDDYYFASPRGREAFWHYHRNTNYSVVDDAVIRDLYRRAYDDDLHGRRLHFLPMTRADGVTRAGRGTRLGLHSLLDDERTQLAVDAVVFATGYEAMEPTALLGDLGRHCLRDEAGRLRVERDYRLAVGDLPCGIYLQGGVEHSHGLSASLLSNIAVRGGEIADSVVRSRAAAVTALPDGSHPRPPVSREPTADAAWAAPGR